MPRAWRQLLHIGVAAHGVSLLKERRWRRSSMTVLAERVYSPSAEQPYDALAQALRALLGEQQWAGWPVRFVLADQLVRMWRVDPPAGATRLADLQASAGLRFQSLYGESPANWQISADWHASKPFFAAAIPRALLNMLQLLADETRLQIISIEPQLVATLNRWRHTLQPDTWLAQVHDGVMSIAILEPDGAAIRAIRVVPLPAGQSADLLWLGQTLQREALLLDLPLAQLLQVCGAAPAHWHQPTKDAGHVVVTLLEHAQQENLPVSSALVQLALSGCIR